MFVVKLSVCGGLLSWRLGVSGRWSSGECWGGVWEDVVDCGRGNFRREGSWVPVGFQVDSGEMWAVFDVERRGRVAGGFGEVGGRILNGSRGVSASGSVRKQEAEFGCFLVDFWGRRVLSLAGDCLGIVCPLSG